MQIATLEDGDGSNFPQVGDRLCVHYVGMLKADNTVFDSSRERGEPFHFILGSGEVITGWEAGLPQMSLGEVIRLVIPSDFGYGREGVAGVIGPDEDLIFDIELLGINGVAQPERRTASSASAAPPKSAAEGLQPCFHAVTGELVGHRDSNGLFHSVCDAAPREPQRSPGIVDRGRQLRAWPPPRQAYDSRGVVGASRSAGVAPQQSTSPPPRLDAAALVPRANRFLPFVTHETSTLVPFLQSGVGSYAQPPTFQPSSGSMLCRQPFLPSDGSFVPPPQCLPRSGSFTCLPFLPGGSFVPSPVPASGPFRGPSLPARVGFTPFLNPSSLSGGVSPFVSGPQMMPPFPTSSACFPRFPQQGPWQRTPGSV